MKAKLLIFFTLFSVSAVVLMAQERGGEGQSLSALDIYRREMKTDVYKAKHRVKKARRVDTRKGNRDLKKSNLSDAVRSFRQALAADSNYAKAQYNLAYAHSRLNQNDSSFHYYKKVCDNPYATSEQRANAHYNVGNIYLRQALSARDTGGYDANSLQAAASQYKAALRLNPKNRDAQHNLSLALQLLRPGQQGGGGGQNQQNQQGQNQQNQQGQQGQQDQQGQQNQQNQQNQQGQQNQQNQQQGQQGQGQQEQQRREAEQMLNAMKHNEQQTMRAVRMKQQSNERRRGVPAKREKDW